MKKLIYFHGFGSSSQSGTIQTLREKLADFEVFAPDIPVDPAEALPFLRELCETEQPDIVVGTSMGGMYAQQMFGFNRICVNPAFEMSVKSKVLKVGTFEYFKPRMDGETHFTITPEIIQHHADMEAKQFDGVTEDEKCKVWGLFGDADQQVNGEPVFRRYYNNVIHFDGEHRMDDKVINDVLIPLIQQITKDVDYRVTFVCTGNACRSPFGETVLKTMLKEYPELKVAVNSCGTLDWGCNPRDERMSYIASNYDFKMEGVTTPMTREILMEADKIIVFTAEHRDAITRVLDSSHWDRIVLFDMIAFSQLTEVEDPCLQSDAVYDRVARHIIDGCLNIMEKWVRNPPKRR